MISTRKCDYCFPGDLCLVHRKKEKIMGTKNNPGDINCYEAAGPDEPIFTLRSTDLCAPSTVRVWAEFYRARKQWNGEWDNAALKKYEEAIHCANQMECWQEDNNIHPICKKNTDIDAANIADHFLPIRR